MSFFETQCSIVSLMQSVCVCVWMKGEVGDGRSAGALSRCSSLSSTNTSSGVDTESPSSDTASHHLIRRCYRLDTM